MNRFAQLFRCSNRLVLGFCILFLPSVAWPSQSVYDFSLVQMDGHEISMSTYRSKVLLIVNLARNSTFNDQLASLEKVYQAYKDKGLVVIGVPSNNFGSGEPGTAAELQKAYADQHVSFPLVAPISVRGKDQQPLYGFLTSGKDKLLSGDVHWSFTKFIVDRTGQVAVRFEPDVDPASARVTMVIEKVLAGTYKKPAVPSDEDKEVKKEDDDDGEQ